MMSGKAILSFADLFYALVGKIPRQFWLCAFAGKIGVPAYYPKLR